MVIKAENRVQRKLNYVIIDEADSVLIDEARTPLIISGGELKNVSYYTDTDRFAKSMKELRKLRSSSKQIIYMI